MPKLGSIIEFGTFKFGTYTLAATPERSKLGEGLSPRFDTVLHPRAGKVIFTPEFKEGIDAPAVLTSLTDSGGILYEGTDLITQALKDALEEEIVSYELKFYIQDDNSNWVDLTDRTESNGRNALRRLGNLTFSAERMRGQLQQSMGRVVLDNTDNFWDSPIPASVKGTFDSNWNSITPLPASFETSFNGKESSFSRHKAAVRVHVTATGSNVPILMTLGVYLIDEIETNEADKSATLKFSPLSTPLVESKASDVKNGAIPWQNRSTNFLVEELLKQHYAESDRSLPVGFDIDDISYVRIPFDGASSWAQSHYGRPPERTYLNNAGTIASTPTWQEPGRVVRALTNWTYATGTISITAGSATVSGSGTGWSTTSSNAHVKLRVGDAFIIPKQRATGDTGSSSGHHGFYTILSVDAGNQNIVLDKTPPGTADESGLSYAIVRVYAGVGTELYEYNISTDTYTQLTTSTTEVGTSDEDHIIRKIWINPTDQTYPIYFAAVRQPYEYESEPSLFRIYRIRWVNDSPDIELVYAATTATDGITLGDMVYREPEYRNSGGAGDPPDWYQIGHWQDSGNTVPNDSEQVPITLPFDQTLQNTYLNSFKYVPLESYGEDADYDDSDRTTVDKRVKLSRGHYSAADTQSLRLAYTIGSTGFFELNPNWGTNGVILFASGQDPTLDANTSDNTTPYREFKYWSIDLDNIDPVFGATVTEITNEDFVGGSETQSGTFTAYEHYWPTCGCVDADGKVYVGLTLFRVNVDNSTYPITEAARAAIIKIENNSGATTVIFNQPGDGATFNGEIFTDMTHYNNGGSKRLYATAYRPVLEMSATNSRYALLLHDNTNVTSAYTALTIKYVSDNVLQAPHQVTYNNGSKIFFHESGSGLRYVDDNTDSYVTTANAATNLSDIPVNEGDNYIFEDQITYIPEALTALWISSSAPSYTQSDDRSGKFYLNLWSFMYPTRIELADFSDMNIWEALNALAEICDARFGFTSEGNFFFKSTPRHTNSSYTFTNVGQHRIFSFAKGRGQTKIANSSNRIPSRGVIGDTEINVELRPNSKYGTGNNRHTISASQRDLLPKTINLRCVKGGSIRSDNTDTNGAEFEYKVLESTFKTNLASDYDKDGGAAAFGVQLEGTEGLRYGSTLLIEGVDSNDNETSSSGNIGLPITFSGTEMVLDGAVDDEQGEFTLKLTSGSLDLDNSMDSVNRRIQTNDVLLVGNISRTDPQFEYVQVVATRGATTAIVSRGSWGGLSPIAHNDESKVWLIKNGNTVYITGAMAYDHSAGDEVTADQPTTDTSSSKYLLDPNDPTSNGSDSIPPEYGTWKPINKEYVSIGEENTPYDTGVSLKLDSDSNSSQKFVIGDTIRVKAKGLILEQDPASVQSAQNALSIKKWQKRDFNPPNNPFLSVLQARWLAKRDIDEEAHPKYTFTLDTILAPWVSLLDTVTVQDADALPQSTQFKETAYIASISMSPQTRGAMSVTLRATRPY